MPITRNGHPLSLWGKANTGTSTTANPRPAMSLTWKLGMAAFCAVFSAYLLGLRLAAPGPATWRVYAAGLSLAVCLLAFVHHLSCLHRTLTALAAKHRGLLRSDGKLLVP
jgi:hypothetical protein